MANIFKEAAAIIMRQKAAIPGFDFIIFGIQHYFVSVDKETSEIEIREVVYQLLLNDGYDL